MRLLVSDGVYHVMARGNEQRPIFRADGDRNAFLATLDRVVARFGWRCFTYCLMDNHFHLLVQTPQPNLPRGMQQLTSSYAQLFNRRHDRIGHLFAARYRSVLVQQDSHLLEVFRYIATNPVRAGLCAHAWEWPWGGHRALVGICTAPGFLATEAALAWFASTGGGDGRRGYCDFVDADRQPQGDMDAVVSGDAAFTASVLADTPRDDEIPKRHWAAGRPALDEILAEDDPGPGIAVAYRQYGYTLASIAEHLSRHVATISRRLSAFERGVLDCKI